MQREGERLNAAADGRHMRGGAPPWTFFALVRLRNGAPHRATTSARRARQRFSAFSLLPFFRSKSIHGDATTATSLSTVSRCHVF